MRLAVVLTRIAWTWCVCGSAAFVTCFTEISSRGGRRTGRFHGNGLVVNFGNLGANGDTGADKARINDADSISEVDPSTMLERLKEEIASLGLKTERGFKSTESEKQKARKLAFQIAQFNPTLEPAACYYPSSRDTRVQGDSLGLEGLWTLIYTDAPDITSLAQNNFAVLGRIGQECNPPYIRNVIEWSRPSWAELLPFSGTEQSRVLQKVVTEAEASSNRPCFVNLKLAGIEVITDSFDDTNSNILQSLEGKGLLSTILNKNPVRLQGPLTAPFGEFEILYLDRDIRIIQTGQGYLAINRRMSPESSWI